MKPQPRTQEQRSSATREALLAAARDTICDKGLVGATTNEIALRAGVSRGAQLHHYASRKQLVLAVADYIWSDVENEVRSFADKLDEAECDIACFITMLWQSVFRPRNFNPIMELVNAARTDEELHKLLSRRWDQLLQVYTEVWRRVLDHSDDTRNANIGPALQMTLCLLRGMAFGQVVHKTDEAANLETLKVWSAMVCDLLDGNAESATILEQTVQPAGGVRK